MTHPTDPKKAAEDMLRSFWPAGRLPVDPVLIAQQLGVRTYLTPLPDDHSGALVKEIGKDPVILLQVSDSTNRQRFTCAHELGHFVRRAGAEEFGFVDYRGPLASTGQNTEEVFANNFAANLLMPEEEFRKQAKNCGNDLLILAKQFMVSAEAVGFRMKRLGLAPK